MQMNFADILLVNYQILSPHFDRQYTGARSITRGVVSALQLIARDGVGIVLPLPITNIESFSVLSAIQNLCQNHGNPPNITNVAVEYVRLLPCRQICPYVGNLSDQDIISAVVHIWEQDLIPLNCDAISMVVLYKKSDGNFPTWEELQNFIENASRMAQDPDFYCVENKKNTPTPGLEGLQEEIYKGEADLGCSICCGEISTGAKIFELPCKHRFHAEPEECLGEFSIKTWLNKSRLCPNCNEETVVMSKGAGGEV